MTLLLVTSGIAGGLWIDATDKWANAFWIGEDGPPGAKGGRTGVVSQPLE
jgi:hypothetical protein